eukprot:scaffold1837_cov391-Prasinococcus_capsulatus_cf.AAC.6
MAWAGDGSASRTESARAMGFRTFSERHLRNRNIHHQPADRLPVAASGPRSRGPHAAHQDQRRVPALRAPAAGVQVLVRVAAGAHRARDRPIRRGRPATRERPASRRPRTPSGGHGCARRSAALERNWMAVVRG